MTEAGPDLLLPVRGWYPDPAGQSGTFRWWDGAGWTSWLSRDPQASDPTEAERSVAGDLSAASTQSVGLGLHSSAAPRMRPPGYERVRRPSPWAQRDVSAAPRQAGRTERPRQTEPAGQMGPAERLERTEPAGLVPGAGEKSPSRLLSGPALMGLGAGVAAVVVVGGVIVLGNQAPPQPLSDPLPAATTTTPGQTAPGQTGPAPTTPSPTPGAAAFDPVTGRFSLQGFRADVPKDPYRSSTMLRSYLPLLSAGVEADAIVQSDYDGSHDWAASMATGQLGKEMIKPDAPTTAKTVFSGWVRANFSPGEGTVGKVEVSAVRLPGADQAEIAKGRVSYRVRGVQSHYDQVSVLVVKLHEGPWVGWMSSRPEKASAQVKDALQDSIDSITVT